MLVFLALCVVIVLLYKCLKIDKLQRNASIILSLYVVVLLYFTVIGRYSHEEYENRIYFYYSYRRLIEHYDSQSMRQILLNIAMLVPVGFMLPMVFNSKGKYLKAIVVSILLIIVIEFLKMLTKTGSCEVDDIINNLLGALLGMALYHMVRRIIKIHKPEKSLIFSIFVFTGYQSFSVGSLLKAIIPVRVVSDGFTSAFIVFFLTIPFLNVLLKHLSEKMHLRLIVLCLFLYTFLGTMPGFGVTMNYVSWFIVIYFISAYVRMYPKQVFEKTSIWGIASLISIALSAFSIFACLYTGWFEQYYFISDSNKILAVVSAFCLFMFFKNVKIPYCRFINVVASASFGVLLIHANSDTMRQWLWKDTLHNAEVFNTSWCYLHFVCSVLGVYVTCTCIDLLRINFLEKPFFKIFYRFSPKLYSKFWEKEEQLLERFGISE